MKQQKKAEGLGTTRAAAKIKIIPHHLRPEVTNEVLS